MEIPILREIVIIFVLSIGVLLICHHLKIPNIVGFLVTGLICGPHGLAFISNLTDVQNLANVGIVLLLFTVGMEFSLTKIRDYKQYFLFGGSIQVFLTIISGIIIAQTLKRPLNESIFLGFLLSLSSTAIVLRCLDQKMQSRTPHGTLIMGMLIFQDIIAIPMMLFIPFLAGKEGVVNMNTLYFFIQGIAILVAIGFISIKIVPTLLYYVTRTHSRELFLLCVLAICFSVAWLTSLVGLSLSLGAFLAGLVIAESEYSIEAIGGIIPFQDLFTSFFFVSIGMLLDLGFVANHFWIIIFITFLVLCLKSFIGGITTIILGMPIRTAVLTGIALSQVGEFSFVIAKSGIDHGIGTEYYYQLFLAVSLLTMAVTPTLIDNSHYFADLFAKLPIPEKFKSGHVPDIHEKNIEIKDHIIIIGFGISGKNLAKLASEATIPYFVLEMDSEQVKKEKLKGEPIHFGDATHANVLLHANIQNARVLAVVVNDPIASLRIVKLARELNDKLYIIVRTRYLKEIRLLYEVGANDVIPDEFGSSVEIFTRVMHWLEVPSEEVEKFVSELRMEGYEQLRLYSHEPIALSQLKINFTDSKIETYRILETSPLTGKSLQEIDLRKHHGLSVLLIKRENQSFTACDPQTILNVGDIIVVAGSKENLKVAKEKFKMSVEKVS